MNVDTLRKVQVLIREYPQHLDMEHWYWNTEGKPTACIAGWVCALKDGFTFNAMGNPMLRKPNNDYDVLARATEIIFGPKPEPDRFNAARRLFHNNEWPSDLRDSFRNAESASERVGVVCMAIDRWIAACQKKFSGEN